MMDGWIVIRKERGFTSHDVVAKLRGILKMKKIGHTGTLDPEAEGVLPVALGSATRLISLMEEKIKTYEAVLRLGVVTDTQDMTGRILEEREVLAGREQIVIRGDLPDQIGSRVQSFGSSEGQRSIGAGDLLIQLFRDTAFPVQLETRTADRTAVTAALQREQQDGGQRHYDTCNLPARSLLLEENCRQSDYNHR